MPSSSVKTPNPSSLRKTCLMHWKIHSQRGKKPFTQEDRAREASGPGLRKGLRIFSRGRRTPWTGHPSGSCRGWSASRGCPRRTRWLPRVSGSRFPEEGGSSPPWHDASGAGNEPFGPDPRNFSTIRPTGRPILSNKPPVPFSIAMSTARRSVPSGCRRSS